MTRRNTDTAPKPMMIGEKKREEKPRMIGDKKEEERFHKGYGTFREEEPLRDQDTSNEITEDTEGYSACDPRRWFQCITKICQD